MGNTIQNQLPKMEYRINKKSEIILETIIRSVNSIAAMYLQYLTTQQTSEYNIIHDYKQSQELMAWAKAKHVGKTENHPFTIYA